MEIPKKIKAAIETNKLIIFVGSGLSIKFNQPNWNKLVSNIVTKLEDPKFNALVQLMDDGIMTPLEVLEKLKSNHNEIKSYIKCNFDLTGNTNDLDSIYYILHVGIYSFKPSKTSNKILKMA